MPGFVLSIFSTLGGWWKSISWTTRLTLIAIIAVVATIYIQWHIIHNNKIKIEVLTEQVSKLQYDQQLKDLENKVAALQTSIDATNGLIATSASKINKLEREVYAPYTPDPSQTAEKVVEGFKAFHNAQ